MVDDEDERQALLRALDDHKRDLRVAIEDLRAAASPWVVLDEVIRGRPGTWLLAGLVAGMWLGRR